MVRSGSIFIVLLTASTLSAQQRDIRGDATVNVWSRYADAVIVLEKSAFRPGEDIPVRFRISNKGSQVLRVYPSREPARTYQFMVTDTRGREIPMKFREADYNRREHGTKEVVSLQGDRSKEVILHPGESFEKTIILNDFFDLMPGTEYRVTGYYYPDARQSFFVRTANTSRLWIDSVADDAVRRRADEDLSRDSGQGISPEETIYLFLSAEMRQNWKNYLKYVDLRKYVTAYDRFAARYSRAAETERPAVLSDFARYLTEHPADRLRRFKITRSDRERNQSGELLDAGRAMVTVQAEREASGYVSSYEYTFVLESDRDGEFWKIIHVTARVMK